MFDEARIKTAVVSIIEAIGEDPRREGLVDTPRRVAEMYAELFGGLNVDPRRELQVGYELGASRNGDYQGHRLLFYVRASPLTLLRSRGHWVDTHWQSQWHFNNKLRLTPFGRVLIHPRARHVELCPSGY